jgi:hypothetical protein
LVADPLKVTPKTPNKASIQAVNILFSVRKHICLPGPEERVSLHKAVLNEVLAFFHKPLWAAEVDS